MDLKNRGGQNFAVCVALGNSFPVFKCHPERSPLQRPEKSCFS